MSSRTRSLLLGLLVLSVTGLLTLVLRGTVAFAPVLVIHLAAVTACFAIARTPSSCTWSSGSWP